MSNRCFMFLILLKDFRSMYMCNCYCLVSFVLRAFVRKTQNLSLQVNKMRSKIGVNELNSDGILIKLELDLIRELDLESGLAFFHLSNRVRVSACTRVK